MDRSPRPCVSSRRCSHVATVTPRAVGMPAGLTLFNNNKVTIQMQYNFWRSFLTNNTRHDIDTKTEHVFAWCVLLVTIFRPYRTQVKPTNQENGRCDQIVF